MTAPNVCPVIIGEPEPYLSIYPLSEDFCNPSSIMMWFFDGLYDCDGTVSFE